MVQIGNGNIALYEHNDAEDVKVELLKLLSTITATNCQKNLDFIYLKKEGKKKQFRRHFCSSSLVYDATGLEDITGRDSKSLHIVVSKFIELNNFNELTLHTFATSNTTNVNDSCGSNSDIFAESPFKNSFPTNESRSRKIQKTQHCQSTVTITETSSVNNVNNVSPRRILTIFNHFYFFAICIKPADRVMKGFWQKLIILQSVQNYFPKSLKLVFADCTLMKFSTLRGGMFIICCS